MNKLKGIKSTNQRFLKRVNNRAINTLLVIAIIAVLTPLAIAAINNVHASGDAYFSLSPSNGSYTVGSEVVVSISETSSSGDNTNAVQANLSYPAQLQYDATSLNGPFTLCGQNKGGGGSVNIGCASSTTESGTQNVAQITFSVVTPGSANVSMSSGSDIDNTSGNSVLSSQALPSANYTLNPVSSSPPPPTTPPPTSSGSSGSSKSSSSSSSSKSSTTVPTPAPSPTTTAPTSSTTPAPSLGSLSISVTNDQGKPIVGAKVGLDNKQFIYTNTSGVADFSAVPSGSHLISITDPGKKTTKTEITLQPGENKLVALKLTSGTSYKTAISVAITIIVILLVLVLCIYWLQKLRRKTPKNTLPELSVTIGDGKAKPKVSNGNELTPTVIQPQELKDQAPDSNTPEPEIRKNDLHPQA